MATFNFKPVIKVTNYLDKGKYTGTIEKIQFFEDKGYFTFDIITDSVTFNTAFAINNNVFLKFVAEYVDDEGNLRALVLSYEPSKASLYEGRKLRDKRGSTYELDPETGMILIDGGDVKLRQLPFGKYILDIQRNIEIQREEERRLEEERQREEEERRQLAISNPPKKGTNWWKVAAAFGGAILVGGIGYCLTQK